MKDDYLLGERKLLLSGEVVRTGLHIMAHMET